ncbi:MAG: hypothetical protein G01um101472_5 [Parcubacteria group bacterium Gr01-1014_72]|nr:MAG: hypothetical protein G01um101472_5 [Parcubacteria group bacterium Gr01-1014_72]
MIPIYELGTNLRMAANKCMILIYKSETNLQMATNKKKEDL